MTQTLTTTEELKHLASSDNANELTRRLARECLANREAQPVSVEAITEVMEQEWNEWCDDTGNFPDDFEWKGGNGILSYEPGKWSRRVAKMIINLTAPPAPAVPDKPRLPPHVYRDLLDMLQEAAIAYGGTQQLRAQLSSALSIHVQPDHPHTRAPMLAAAPEGSN